MMGVCLSFIVRGFPFLTLFLPAPQRRREKYNKLLLGMSCRGLLGYGVQKKSRLFVGGVNLNNKSYPESRNVFTLLPRYVFRLDLYPDTTR